MFIHIYMCIHTYTYVSALFEISRAQVYWLYNYKNVYVHVHEYISVYFIYIHVCIHSYIYTRAHMHTRMRALSSKSVMSEYTDYMHMNTYMYTYMYMYMYMCMQAYVYIYIVHIYTHIFIHIYICIWKYTFTYLSALFKISCVWVDWLHVYVYVYVYVYEYEYVYVCMHIPIHSE